MAEVNSRADHSRNLRVERALEILNVEPTEEMLRSRLEEVSGSPELARHGPALFARREEIGSFQVMSDLEGIEGLSETALTELIDGLNLPDYGFESETLESVCWAHGSGLEIEAPEAFGSIRRRPQGIRISSLRFGDAEDRPLDAGRSWAQMSIPVPTFAAGKKFYVKSVLFNFTSYPEPYSPVKGGPLATPYELQVWDGHVRIAEEQVLYPPDSWTRYLRIPVESSRTLRWGLAVCFDLYVRSVHESADYGFWIDIGAVGVELVSRTGLVVNASP